MLYFSHDACDDSEDEHHNGHETESDHEDDEVPEPSERKERAAERWVFTDVLREAIEDTPPPEQLEHRFR
jgi:hypothetical protein